MARKAETQTDCGLDNLDGELERIKHFYFPDQHWTPHDQVTWEKGFWCPRTEQGSNRDLTPQDTFITSQP